MTVFSIYTIHNISTLTVTAFVLPHNITVKNLPDTGGPSETNETSRSSDGLVAAGDTAG